MYHKILLLGLLLGSVDQQTHMCKHFVSNLTTCLWATPGLGSQIVRETICFLRIFHHRKETRNRRRKLAGPDCDNTVSSSSPQYLLAFPHRILSETLKTTWTVVSDLKVRYLLIIIFFYFSSILLPYF